MMTESRQRNNGCRNAILIFVSAPLLLCGTIYFLWTAPWLTWQYGREMQNALETYEQVRSAVFRGEKSLPDLETIAQGDHLQHLQQTIKSGRSIPFTDPQTAHLIHIARVRDYESNCAVIMLTGYSGDSQSIDWFVLVKQDNHWKVTWAMSGNGGLAPTVPWGICQWYR